MTYRWPCRGGRGARRGSSSYNAVCNAVSSLHRLDDFSMEPLGSGFFSQVFKVVHVVSKKTMVLKMNISAANKQNVLREIQLLNRLSHPNLLKLLGVCVHDAQLHALVEYMSEGSLEDVISRSHVRSADGQSQVMSWSVRIRLACDVAKALKYLHSERIMHRDLTSKNILIRGEREDRLVAVVGDLGLACVIPDPLSDKALPVVGSPYWMAPECINGKRYNEKADVFSYGIVLCEMVALVEADPDVLPRTKKFGVDYVAFSKMVTDCPLHLLHLTFTCCQIEAKKRPSFSDLVVSLEEMKTIGQMAVILTDISRFGLYNSATTSIDRIVLERILDTRQPKRARSDEVGGFTEAPAPPCGQTVTPQGVETCRRFVPVTPLMVGRVMSRDDAHYAPHKDNPFTHRFRDASAKIIDGLIDSLVDSFDSTLLSPRGLEAPPATPNTPLDPNTAQPMSAARRVRRCHSLPASPRDFRRRFDFIEPSSGASMETGLESGLGLGLEKGLNMREIGLDTRFDIGSEAGSDGSVDSAVICCHDHLVNLCLNCVMLGGEGSPSTSSVGGSSSLLFSPSTSSCSHDDSTRRGRAEQQQRQQQQQQQQQPQQQHVWLREEERWRSEERFRTLMRLWEHGSVVNSERRNKAIDSTCVLRSVEELRRVWENVIRLHVASCRRFTRYTPTSNHPSSNHPSSNHPSSNHPLSNHPSSNHPLPSSNHPLPNHPSSNHLLPNHTSSSNHTTTSSNQTTSSNHTSSSSKHHM